MHTNPEVLALVALGESAAATPEDLDHIAQCPACGQEVDELCRLSRVGRTISQHYTLEVPSPQVWERIRSQLGFSDTFSSALVPPATARVPTAGQPSPPPPAQAARTQSETAPAVAAPPAPITYRPDLPPRRSRRTRVGLVLAVVIALVAGVGGTLAWQRLRPLGETVVASTTLAALPDWTGASGEATLERDASGRQVLVVTMATPRPVDGIQQVWLIDREVATMIPIGQLTSPVQSFTLAGDVDVTRFPVVDISVEPPDGDLTHSGNSIVRGTLAR